MDLSRALFFLVVLYFGYQVDAFRARKFKAVNKTEAIQKFRNVIKSSGKTDADIDRLIEKVKKFKEIHQEKGIKTQKLASKFSFKRRSHNTTVEDPEKSAFPVEEGVDFGKANAALSDILIEGDILPTEAQIDEWTKHALGQSKFKRQMSKTFGRWPVKPATIAYYFDASFSDATFQDMVRKGFKYWEDHTCLKYVEDNSATNKIQVVTGGGCTSIVGMAGGSQALTLGPNCNQMPVVLHEIGHSIGLFHQHSRYDRDTYVAIQPQNIADGQQNQFEIRTTSDTDNHDTLHDYGSVMHYGEWSFSKIQPDQPGWGPTMIAANENYQTTMGGGFLPSIEDIMIVNTHYGCKCSPDPACLNGGIPNPNDCSKCICPWGFFGKLCADRDPGNFACGEVLTATSTWTPLEGTMTVGQPGDQYDPSKELSICHWHITSPPGTVIEIKVKSWDGNTKGDSAMSSAFEVVYENLRLGGARFGLTRDIPGWTMDLSSAKVMKSTQNLAVIHLWNKFGTAKFTLEYRTVAADATTSTTTTAQPGGSTTTTNANQGGSTTTTGANGPCNEDSRCSTWVTNGFCTSTFYTAAQKETYCPKACKLGCGASSTPCNDHANCAQWVNQGFCANSFYTLAQRTSYCPKACKLGCGAANVQTPTCTDDSRCLSWSQNGFCSNSFYTLDMKKSYCPNTCGLCSG